MLAKYEPSKQEIEKLEIEIKQNIKGELLNDDEFITDCAKIGAFLMDNEATDKLLQKLNDKLAHKLENTNLEEKGTGKKFRTFLEQELKKFGFQEKFVQVLGKKALTAKEFHNLLSQSFFLKDSSLRPTKHGEFGHAIQWILIAWQQQETNFLSMKVDEIYKKLGDQDAKTDIPNQSAWFVICDEPEDEQYGFRSPEYLGHYITENENKFPILEKLLSDRRKKEMGHFADKLKNPPSDKYEKNEEIPSVLMPKRRDK